MRPNSNHTERDDALPQNMPLEELRMEILRAHARGEQGAREVEAAIKVARRWPAWRRPA